MQAYDVNAMTPDNATERACSQAYTGGRAHICSAIWRELVVPMRVSVLILHTRIYVKRSRIRFDYAREMSNFRVHTHAREHIL